MRAALLAAVIACGPAAAQDLRGHGGPVRALAVDGDRVISGSFDTRAILWEGVSARQVTRAHDGAVTAVIGMAGGFASGGQDGRVAVWGSGAEPTSLVQRHAAPVSALAVLDGVLVSAGWDGRIVAGDADAGFEAHQGQVTGLVAHGGGLASTGTDLRLRLWEAPGQGTPGQGTSGQGARLVASFDLPSPPTALVSTGAALVVAAADGVVRRFEPGQRMQERALSDRPLPVVALAARDGLIAAASVTGEVWLLDAADLTLRRRIDSAQGAVWAVALTGDTLLTGGNDGLVRRWTLDGVALGPGLAASAPGSSGDGPGDGSRGAEVWRACAVCHTLTPDDASRAGPSLHGLFGRRIATAPGYDYSAALRGMDIVWTPATLSALFEQGPEAFTPGSRMPEQRIPDAADRAALAEFLSAYR